MKSSTLWIAVIALASATAAHAGETFGHPATSGVAETGAQQLAAASPVSIGHPASPHWKVVHANAEHPAVIVYARVQAVDPNLFIVQPPTSVHWATASAPAIDSAAAVR